MTVCDSLTVAYGWRYEFKPRDWVDVRDFLGELDWGDNQPDYLFQIIRSVLAVGGDRLLAVTMSAKDLVLASLPVDDPPLDVVVVCAPGSARSHPAGTVRIDHIGVNGPNTEVVVPAVEAVALFWRFMETEFGIRPSGTR